MKIGLNATCFNERPSGAKQRFVGIYGPLMRRLSNVEFVLYEPEDCRVASWFDTLSNVTSRRAPIRSEGRVQRIFKGLSYWSAELESKGFTFFERFNLPVIRPAKVPTLMTVHDIRDIFDGGPLYQMVCRAYVHRSLSAADRIITVSETMKREILSYWPALPVSVIYNGIDAAQFSNVDEAITLAMRHRYSLPEEFVLAVGHFEKRKNYLRLLESVAILGRRGVDCPLVIVGNDSGEGQAIRAAAAALSLKSRVYFLTNLSDLEVRCAYKLCRLLVFPSLYEGFGIPILEAMAARRPMVLSNLAVFREITEDQAIYFSPKDVEAMADGIERGLCDEVARDELVSYGSHRVKDFSFDKLAGQVAGLYAELC